MIHADTHRQTHRQTHTHAHTHTTAFLFYFSIPLINCFHFKYALLNRTEPNRSLSLATDTTAEFLWHMQAHNDLKIRNKAVKKLRLWLAQRGDANTETDLLKLWKGLFYCMWMSDKPLVQEELAKRECTVQTNTPCTLLKLLHVRGRCTVQLSFISCIPCHSHVHKILLFIIY